MANRTGRPAVGVFLMGMICGVLAVGALASGFLYQMQESGLHVRLQSEEIAQAAQGAVAEAVRRELPAMAARLSRELPDRVAAEVGRRVASTQVEVGSFRVSVPPGAVREVEAVVRESLQGGVEAVLREADLDNLAARLGEEASGQLRKRMGELPPGQVTLELWPGLKLPVAVIISME